MKAVFLDRDGTVIVDRGYLADPAGVALEPGAADALRRFHHAGYALVFVSNQSGIGRGLMTPAECEAVHRRTLDLLAAEGVPITASYICPHAPWDRCECRKPSTILIERAAAEHGIDFARSFVIGDKKTDIQMGHAAGSRTILYAGGHSGDEAGGRPDYLAAAWSDIAEWVLARTSP